MAKSKIITLIFVSIMSLFCIVKLAMEPNVQEVQAIGGGDNSKILLYFYDKKAKTLACEFRNIELNRIKENLEEVLITELLKGPELPDYEAVIPESTVLKDIKKEGMKIVLDFSKEFVVEGESEEERTKKIFAIVYTLTEIKEINEVEIRVEGEVYAVQKRI